MGPLLELRKVVENQKTIRTGRLKELLYKVISDMNYKDKKIKEQAATIRRLNKHIQQMRTRKDTALRKRYEAEAKVEQLATKTNPIMKDK